MLLLANPEWRAAWTKRTNPLDRSILRSNKSGPMDTIPVSSLSHGPGEGSVTVEDFRPEDSGHV
jgi:hypothetical protein